MHRKRPKRERKAAMLKLEIKMDEDRYLLTRSTG